MKNEEIPSENWSDEAIKDWAFKQQGKVKSNSCFLFIDLCYGLPADLMVMAVVDLHNYDRPVLRTSPQNFMKDIPKWRDSKW